MLTNRTWFFYGFGHVLNDLCASMWFTYLLVFFRYVLQLESSTAGTAMFIGQIADGISTPLIGILSDNGFSYLLPAYGTRKTWHLIGSVCVLCTFPFIFSPCELCEYFNFSEQLLYYSVFIIIFQFGWAAVQVSHLSLVPDLTPIQNERTSLLTLRYSFTVISNIIVHLLTWYVLKSDRIGNSNIGPSDRYKFRLVALVVVAIGLLSTIIFHAGVDEKVASEKPARKISDSATRENKRSILSDFNVYHIMFVYLSTQLFVNQSMVYLPLYLQDYLKVKADLLAISPLVLYLVSFITSSIIKPLNADFGRKTAYSCGAIIGIGGCLWLFEGGKGPAFAGTYIYAVVALLGCSSSIMLVTSLGITADLIGSNTQNGAFIYGLMSFVDKIGNGVGVMIVEYLRNFITAETYYRNVLFYICGASILLGMISVVTLPRVSLQNDFGLEEKSRSDSIRKNECVDGKDNCAFQPDC